MPGGACDMVPRVLEQDLTLLSRGYLACLTDRQGTLEGALGLAIRRRWPQVHQHYRQQGLPGGRLLALGTVQVVLVGPELWLAGLCARESWGRLGSQLDWDALEVCLRRLRSLTRPRAHLPVYLGLETRLPEADWLRLLALLEDCFPEAVPCRHVAGGLHG